jgi:NADP-dependent 3-hydroxy acid dehydrogenase YdfG
MRSPAPRTSSAETTRGDAIAKVTDVSCREDLTEFVALAAETYGQLDVLVSNAGIMPVSQFDELRVGDWEAMVDVNLKGVLFGIAAALPVFRRQGFGHFVNIASTAAFRVTPGQSVYAGTKMAVRAISEGLRQEAGENPARPLRTHRAETPRSEPSKRKSDVLGMDSLSLLDGECPDEDS